MNIIKPIKTIVSISTVCAILVFSNASSARASGYDVALDSPMYHKKSKHMMKRMIKVLSLSEQQQVQIKAIKSQAKEQSETLSDSMQQFKGAEKLLMQAETFDEHAFIALHTAYQQTFSDIALSRAKAKHAIFNVLTTEQQEKWLETVEKHKGRNKKN